MLKAFASFVLLELALRFVGVAAAPSGAGAGFTL